LVFILTVGLFGVHQIFWAPFVATALPVEAAGVLVLVTVVLLHRKRPQ
jgi:hypothetical protein